MENHENPPVKQSLAGRLSKFFFGDPQEARKDMGAEHQSTLGESKILPKTWFEDEYSAKK